MCDEHCVKVNDIFENLCRTLSSNGDVNLTSREFYSLLTNSSRVDFASDLLCKYQLLPEFIKNAKDEELSIKYRQEGNVLFKDKKDAAAWKMYTMSISHAPANSECLSLAYANRSAVLYEKHLYKECLQDIRRAFMNNYPKNLHEKLIQRQIRASKLQNTQEIHNYYEDVPILASPDAKVKCASSSIEIHFKPNFERHVLAVKDIQIGDIIAIEKPFAKILLKEDYMDHCFYCFQASYNLFPCSYCTNAFFCSEKCKELAWNQFHQYDCHLLSTLLNLEITKLVLLALRVCICAKSEYGNIENYHQTSKVNMFDVYKSERYEEIHFLVTNSHKRKNCDLFPRAVTAAILFALVEERTTFFNDFKDINIAKNIFKDLILRHLQTGPSNFHEISELLEKEDKIYETVEIGAGAYSFLSLLNHSCAPNVVRHCHGATVVLRALRPISRGQQLFDNYGYHHAVMKRGERQKHLEEQYFFQCKCEACEYNWPLYKYLPMKQCYFELTEDHLTSLKQGDSEVAKKLLNILIDKATIIENIRPCKNLADIQESIKQCFAIFGNKWVQL